MPINKPDDLVHQIALKLANQAFDCLDNQKRLEALKFQVTQNSELVKLRLDYLHFLIQYIDCSNELKNEAISAFEVFLAGSLLNEEILKQNSWKDKCSALACNSAEFNRRIQALQHKMDAVNLSRTDNTADMEIAAYTIDVISLLYRVVDQCLCSAEESLCEPKNVKEE